MKTLEVFKVVLLGCVAASLLLIAVRLHQIDQTLEDCSEFLQVICGK